MANGKCWHCDSVEHDTGECPAVFGEIPVGAPTKADFEAIEKLANQVVLPDCGCNPSAVRELMREIVRAERRLIDAAKGWYFTDNEQELMAAVTRLLQLTGEGGPPASSTTK